MKLDQAVASRLENRVLADYRAVAGKVLMASVVSGYLGDTDDSGCFKFDPPLAVRVDAGMDAQPQHGLFHWNDEWLDPYWDVTIIGTHPDLPPEGLRSAWIDGTSYNAETGECERYRWRFETFREKVRRLLGV